MAGFFDVGHGICKSPCGRPSTNLQSFVFQKACHGDMPCRVCTEPCEVRCSHSRLVSRAHDRLDLARTICTTDPGQTAGMPAGVSDAEGMLRAATFYAPVTNSEEAAVYAAVARGLQGTGIGERGMSMQMAGCPRCGAAVGARDHQAAAGVTPATDLEAEDCCAKCQEL